MRKFGEVLDYRTADKALIGYDYIFSDDLREICEHPEKIEPRLLAEVFRDDTYPFAQDRAYEERFQFCRQVIEEEVLMTNRQLAEWLGKGKGQKAYLKNKYAPEEGIDLEYVLTCHEYDGIKDDEPCAETIRIRLWGSDEWVEPTLEIYERDCKANNKQTKEERYVDK